MNLVYKTSESSFKPDTIESTPTAVYLRKDIEEKQRLVDRNGESFMVQYYEYQEAKLSHEDFDIYSAELASINAVKGVNVPDNISQIMQDGVNSSDNQLVLMEAMADLYDLIAMMLG